MTLIRRKVPDTNVELKKQWIPFILTCIIILFFIFYWLGYTYGISISNK